MPINTDLLEIREHTNEGYLPLVDYGEWRVAVLRYIDELLPQNIDRMQRHDATDEVFVLLNGRCILFIGEGDKVVSNIFAQDMEPLKIYNVKRSCWHTHTVSEDATVLIVGNRDTAVHNSPEVLLDVFQRDMLLELTHRLWEGARWPCFVLTFGTSFPLIG